MIGWLFDLIGLGVDVLHFNPGKLTGVLLLAVAILIVLVLILLSRSSSL
ncbi:MAG: hypothetical protein U0452_11390 [Anaerolineae bacterium]